MPSNKADAQKVNPASSSPELIPITYKELKQAHYRIAADTTDGRERAGAAGAAAADLAPAASDAAHVETSETFDTTEAPETNTAGLEVSSLAINPNQPA